MRSITQDHIDIALVQMVQVKVSMVETVCIKPTLVYIWAEDKPTSLVKHTLETRQHLILMLEMMG